MMKNDLLVTLTTTELRTLIGEVLDEKLKPVPSLPEVSNGTPLISRIEVARLFGVSKTTIDKWRRHHVLPPIIKIASRVYFYKDQIQENLKKRQRQPNLFINL
jgi:predicted DNA-binding transcriptional regulator AlpA